MTQLTESLTTSLETARGTFRVVVDGAVSAPALILSNSLGTTLEMWDPQVSAFSRDYRLIRYDTRGHGGSPSTPGPYSFAELGHDVLAVLDALNISKATFCGISMGGHTGLWLGVHAGTSKRRRLSSRLFCNSLPPWRSLHKHPRKPMLYLVHMIVNIPSTVAPDEAARIKAEEKAYSEALQHSGKWPHLWRVVGEYANYSVFDVASNDELHDTLSKLPLFPFMSITVTPLAKHPSSIV